MGALTTESLLISGIVTRGGERFRVCAVYGDEVCGGEWDRTVTLHAINAGGVRISDDWTWRVPASFVFEAWLIKTAVERYCEWRNATARASA